MEEKKITEIIRLSASGRSHAEIAETLGIPLGSVKTALYRSKSRCEWCGKPLPGRRSRFCSDACRNAWWNGHRDCAERVCPTCGKAFKPKDPRRVYCCAACYHGAGGKRDGEAE